MKVSQSSAHCSLIFINHVRKFKLMDRWSGHWWDTETEVDFNLLLWWKCRCLQFTDGDRGDRPSSWSSLTGSAWRPLKHTRKKRSHDQTLVNTVIVQAVNKTQIQTVSIRRTNKVNSNPPSRLKLLTLTEKTNLLTWEQQVFTNSSIKVLKMTQQTNTHTRP